MRRVSTKGAKGTRKPRKGGARSAWSKQRDHCRSPNGFLSRPSVRVATGESVEIACVDQGHTGDRPQEAAREHGIQLEVVKMHEAKRGFVLLPRRWVVERSSAWASRFRRLARDYERPAETIAALHFLVSAILMLAKAAPLLKSA